MLPALSAETLGWRIYWSHDLCQASRTMDWIAPASSDQKEFIVVAAANNNLPTTSSIELLHSSRPPISYNEWPCMYCPQLTLSNPNCWRYLPIVSSIDWLLARKVATPLLKLQESLWPKVRFQSPNGWAHRVSICGSLLEADIRSNQTLPDGHWEAQPNCMWHRPLKYSKCLRWTANSRTIVVLP